MLNKYLLISWLQSYFYCIQTDCVYFIVRAINHPFSLMKSSVFPWPFLHALLYFQPHCITVISFYSCLTRLWTPPEQALSIICLYSLNPFHGRLPHKRWLTSTLYYNKLAEWGAYGQKVEVTRIFAAFYFYPKEVIESKWSLYSEQPGPKCEHIYTNRKSIVNTDIYIRNVI